MDYQALKQKLLDTNQFIDNNYLDNYCHIIINNLDTKKQKYITNRHHIIPKCYYTINNLPVDNSKDNLVNLLYKDHILAHYYLCFCIATDSKILKPLNFAANLMLNKTSKIQTNGLDDLKKFRKLPNYL